MAVVRRLVATVAVSALLASAWLGLAYVGNRTGLAPAVAAGGSWQAALGQAVTRTGVTRSGTKVQVLFGTPEYYERTGQSNLAGELNALVYLVFVVTEENHSRVATAPIPELRVDGRPVAAPVKVRTLSESDHHRTRILRYPRYGPGQVTYVPESARVIELVWPDLLPQHLPNHAVANPLRWELPIQYPEPIGQGRAPSPVAFLALTAGLFAALSPCLLQLTLYYLSNLAGAAAAATGTGAGGRAVVRAALWFSAGLVVAYTLGGYLAGLAGSALQAQGALGPWGRWVAVAAGVAMIALGLYQGAAARAPGICRLPLPGVQRLARPGGPASAAMGFLMAVGCLQCFGGALFASLLLYVGSLGSPSLGALMLFLFALGVAIPFVAAAAVWSRAAPLLQRVQGLAPYLGLAGSGLMVTFGVLMVADRFHWVSGVLLEWLPLLRP